MTNSKFPARLGGALAILALAALPAHGAQTLIAPGKLTVESTRPLAETQAQLLAARRYASFWATGEETLARAALAADFMDRTLPPGRAQGIEGPLAASRGFRSAVPDLSCAVEQTIVAGDRIVVHLHFTGHFSGRFQNVQGTGQAINFIATDIYRIADGRIAENWHIEDNLTLLQQMGILSR